MIRTAQSLAQCSTPNTCVAHVLDRRSCSSSSPQQICCCDRNHLACERPPQGKPSSSQIRAEAERLFAEAAAADAIDAEQGQQSLAASQHPLSVKAARSVSRDKPVAMKIASLKYKCSDSEVHVLPRLKDAFSNLKVIKLSTH